MGVGFHKKMNFFYIEEEYFSTIFRLPKVTFACHDASDFRLFECKIASAL